MKKYVLFSLLTLLILPSQVKASALYSQPITLNQGWNIVSTPKVLESHTFSVAETSNNFDIYALDASKTSGWSTLADLGQTEFTPLFGYFINNKTGSNQTLTFNYKNVSIPEQLFNRTFTTSGWYSFGIANSSYAKSADSDNTDINNPDNILQSLIGTSVHYGDVVDFTDANSSTSSVAVSNPLKSATRSADISNSTEINTLKDFRETKGYAIYIKDSNVTYNGLQNKTIPQCQDGIDNDSDGNIDMADTGCVNSIDNVEYTLPSKLAIISSSTNPEASNIAVDSTDITNDVLIGAFKLDVDDDSSDIKINKLPITVKITGAGASVTSSGSVIDSIVVKIDGINYSADVVDSSIDNTGTDTAIYEVDASSEDLIINAEDIVEVKVYATFLGQDGNYTNGTTIVSSGVDSNNIEAEGVGTINDVELSGLFSGNNMILNTDVASITNERWVISSTGTIADFFFTVSAETDFNVLINSIVSATTGTATISSPVITKYSGDATAISSPDTGYVVYEGDTASFRVRYVLTGTNGTWGEITITSIANQVIPDDKQTSPTATLNIE